MTGLKKRRGVFAPTFFIEVDLPGKSTPRAQALGKRQRQTIARSDPIPSGANESRHQSLEETGGDALDSWLLADSAYPSLAHAGA
jgi:hypothetical protein